jgi:hypothetical protein
MDVNDRNGRDAAGIGPYARERETLTPLSTLGSWKVSEGEPDIRGWDVRTVSGRQLGSVADLLIDAQAGEVVLLDVDLPASDNHTFVPIRVVHIDRTRRIVMMDSADLPDGHLTRGDRSVVVDGRPASAGTVRYPHTDREVIAERAQLADSAPLYESSDASLARAAEERRRIERRRIDRVSTDL